MIFSEGGVVHGDDPVSWVTLDPDECVISSESVRAGELRCSSLEHQGRPCRDGRPFPGSPLRGLNEKPPFPGGRDIIDAIDFATGCQECGGPLGESPSTDFCRPEHQQAWHAARSKPLEHYSEAGHDFWVDEVRFNAPEPTIGSARDLSMTMQFTADTSLLELLTEYPQRENTTPPPALTGTVREWNRALTAAEIERELLLPQQLVTSGEALRQQEQQSLGHWLNMGIQPAVSFDGVGHEARLYRMGENGEQIFMGTCRVNMNEGVTWSTVEHLARPDEPVGEDPECE